ncbi:flagellar assembly protein FliH [Sporolactobacillus kofuensis]|uniref:Flagellar assembly protein FliH n=1 Tax=Sporolactobacillus kofuensis TaxID=269672 RepID=A0ABW1WAB9_9BACL|nr:flagellar assembly protein FliH [Sporolactobacillus kofuensis]MCO7174689.1 flagellar assembly protein FliH [Sporolactobacillus kofuensis]
MSNLIKRAQTEGEAKIVQISAIIDPQLDALTDEMDQESIEKTLTEKINQAKHEAARIIREAEEEQARMQHQIETENERAKQKREEAHQKSVKEGYEAGFLQGTKEAKEKYAKQIQQGNLFVDQAQTYFNEYIKKAEPEILSLSMAVAEKIIATSVALDEDKWFSLVEKAVREVRDQETIKITVAPIHFESINQHIDELKKLVQDAKIFIYADSDFSNDQCTIETSFGKIDAGVRSQLQVIKEKLSELMEEH